MSWFQPAYLTHFAHSTKLYRAISMALLTSIAGASQAATIGSTEVQSNQNEPLTATIAVTDIDTERFSASLADANIYSRLGLQPTDTMSVRFVPTSKTSGQIIINTSKPVSTPFTDVVLSINDKGQQQMLPKTLLMPLDKVANKVDTMTMVNKTKPNLPVVSPSEGKPLIVKRSPPPPLLPSVSPVNTGPTTVNNGSAVLNSNSATMTSDSAASLPNSQATSVNLPSQNDNSLSEVPTMAPASVNRQFDILNIEVIRRLQPTNQSDAPIQSSVLVQSNTSIEDLKNNQANNASNNVSQNLPKAPKTRSNTPLPTTPKVDNTVAAPAESKVVYIVQRNDNLWSIADEIARQNKVDVGTVMSQIHNQNPDAFIEENANLLKANAQLKLPNYKVIPSQQSLQAAIRARHAQQSPTANPKPVTPAKPAPAVTANAPKPPKPAAPAPSTARDKPVSAPAKTVTNGNTRPSPPQTVTQNLPKARMTVIAPSKDNNAAGTQTKTSTAPGSGITTDIMATLKSSRLKAAAQAKRVREVNVQLTSYTQKLQLQNQKLAELEARLKELKNQK
ncbi:MAG: FimV/HubP family polar landmark protein [Psychrobacter sp.]|nr:FimV/HubP family polar landmark protein [Psychrobacter sp.]